MPPLKGYYSLIQFCPDASRLETVNLGVVLFCPDANFIAAKIAKANKRAEKLVKRSELDRGSLDAAKRAIERRLAVDRDAFQSLEDIQRFVDTRANILKLTTPRPVKVFNPEGDIERLFDELVGGIARAEKEASPATLKLDTAFRQLHQQGRARLDVDVEVPLLGHLRIPYAYRNGVWNYVKPQRFASREKSALDVAKRLAIEGDLISGHGENNLPHDQLVVVSMFDSPVDVPHIERRVFDVLQAYKVWTVRESEVEAFISKVMQQAH